MKSGLAYEFSAKWKFANDRSQIFCCRRLRYATWTCFRVRAHLCSDEGYRDNQGPAGIEKIGGRCVE